MKRKFTNVFLLVAISIAALSSFVSCKDYEDDLRMEMVTQSTGLKGGLDDLKNYLDVEIQKLWAAHERCSVNCSTARANLRIDLITVLGDSLKNYYTIYQVDSIFNLYYSKTEIQEILKDYYTIHESDSIMKFKMDSLKTNIIGDLSTIAENKTIAELIKMAIDEAKYARRQVDTLKLELETTNMRIDLVNSRIDTLVTHLMTVDKMANEAWKMAEKAQKTAEDALKLAQADSVRLDAHDKILENHTQLIGDLQEAVKNIEERLDDFATKTALEEVRKEAEAAMAKALANEILLNKIAEEITSMKNEIYNMQTDIADIVEEKIPFLEKKDSILSDSIQWIVKELEKYVKHEQLRDSLDTIRVAISAKIDSVKAVEMFACKVLTDRWLRNLSDSMRLNYDTLRIARDSIFTLGERLGVAEDQIENLLKWKKDTADVELTTLMNWKKAVEKDVADIPNIRTKLNNVSDSLKTLYHKVDSIEKAVNDTIAKVKERVSKLENRVDNVEDRLNKLITNIIIQAAYNPIYGTVNTPFGLSSNLLLTYWGENLNATVNFPTTVEDDYYRGDKSPTIFDDVSVFTGSKEAVSGMLLDDAKGNAGTLFVTINPTNVDFSNTKFSLVNSVDKEAPITLEKVEKSSEELRFGWTRAGANNGFYSMKATVTDPKKLDLLTGLNLSKADFKAIYDDIKYAYQSSKDKSMTVKLTSLAKGVIASAGELSNINLAPAAAYGLKAAWQEKVANGNMVDTATYSKYEVAALTIKPLSFASFNALDEKNIAGKGLEVMENAISRIGGTIQKQVRDMIQPMKFEMGKSKISTIQFDEINWDGVALTIKNEYAIDLGGQSLGTAPVTIPESQINKLLIEDPLHPGTFIPLQTADGKGLSFKTNPIIVPDGTKIKLYMEFAEPLQQTFQQLGTNFNNLNDFVKYLKGYLGDLNDFIDQMSGTGEYVGHGMVENMGDKVVNALEKVFNRFGRFMTPSEWLQPIALVYDGQNIKAMTNNTISRPAVVNSEKLTFVLTSRTAELLAPAYKKWFACAKAYSIDGAGNLTEDVAARDAANSGEEMNTVLRGINRKSSVTLQKDHVYEFLYQAIDYHGKVSAKRYFVEVK